MQNNFNLRKMNIMKKFKIKLNDNNKSQKKKILFKIIFQYEK